jgi:hypothetical protein
MLELFDLAPKERLIAQLLLSRGLITTQGLHAAMRSSKDSLFFTLVEVLIGQGSVTIEKIQDLLFDYCKKLRLGELALVQGVVTSEQLEFALLQQEAGGARIGEIFIEMNLATPQQIEMLLEFQRRCRVEAAAC